MGSVLTFIRDQSIEIKVCDFTKPKNLSWGTPSSYMKASFTEISKKRKEYPSLLHCEPGKEDKTKSKFFLLQKIDTGDCLYKVTAYRFVDADDSQDWKSEVVSEVSLKIGA